MASAFLTFLSSLIELFLKINYVLTGDLTKKYEK